MMLYKYRSLSTNADPYNPDNKTPRDYTLDLLRDNEFYFSSPDQFNDPFDCYIPDFVLKNKADWINLADFMKEVTGNDAIKESIINTGKHYAFDSESSAPPNTPLHIKENLKNIKKTTLREGHRIFSLSKNKDNILMWAHYADSFSGICLGFETKTTSKYIYSKKIMAFAELVRDPISYNDTLSKYLECYKVKYKNNNKLPIDNNNIKALTSYPAQFDKTIKKLLTRKHKQWKYEDEYRLITNTDIINPSTNKLKFDKAILKEIIFGFNLSTDNIETIKKEIKSIILAANYPNVNFYQCIPKPDEYGVNIVPDK